MKTLILNTCLKDKKTMFFSRNLNLNNTAAVLEIKKNEPRKIHNKDI